MNDNESLSRLTSPRQTHMKRKSVAQKWKQPAVEVEGMLITHIRNCREKWEKNKKF